MNWQAKLGELEGWEAVAASSGLLLAAVITGLIAYGIIFHLLLRWAVRTPGEIRHPLFLRWRGPSRFLLPLLLISLVSPLLRFPAEIESVLRQVFSLLLIGGLAWLAVNSILAVRAVILSHYDIEAKDNLRARAMVTQLSVLVKIALVIIGTIAVASMLMTFEPIRQVGVSILASAGIAGVIAGFAAQRSIAALFAGVQIALTQPIRLDDVVIVEGEWGKIEEISLTYVVVRIWDQRRLILPITYFLEKPFQNWTRTSADLLSTVSLFTDYTISVDAVRRELGRVLQESEYWDGQVQSVQVTNSTERTMEVRALMSAADSGSAWNLRCEVREKLLKFLQENYPESLPRVRADVKDS